MKKKLLGLLLGIVVLGVGIVGFALYNLDSLIARFKPDLEQIASKAVKRDVHLGPITTSFFPSVGLTIQELKVGEQADAFRLKNVGLSTALLPLFSGNLAVNSITVSQPEVTLIRDAAGAIRVAGLPKSADKAEQKAEPAPEAAGEKAPRDGTAEGSGGSKGLALRIDGIAVTDVLVKLLDEASSRSHTLVSGLSVNTTVALQGTTLDTPALRVRASVLEHAALAVDGSAKGLGGPNATAEVKGSLSKLDFAKLAPLLQTMQIALPIPLNGGADATFNVTGALTAPVLDSSVNVTLNGEPIKLTSHIVLSPDTVALEPTTLDAFGGSLAAAVKAALTGDKTFTVALTGGKLLIERALAALQMGGTVPLTGSLASLDVKLAGAQGPQMMQALTGSVGLELRDGALKGQNLAGAVLKLINNIPSVSGSLFENVPPEQREGLTSADTAIQSMILQATIARGALQLSKFSLVNPIFTLEADGEIRFDTTLDLKASMLFSKAFSSALAERSGTIKKMLDAEGRFVVPLQLQGKAASPVILPNMQKLLEGAAGKLLQDKASDLLGKALGGKKEKGLGGLLGF